MVGGWQAAALIPWSLLQAAAAAGARIKLITYGSGNQLTEIDVRTAPLTNRPRWWSLSNLSPGSAWALAKADAKVRIEEQLTGGEFAAVVVNHAAMGWALPLVERAGVPLVYLSHNHEASVRPGITHASSPLWKEPLLRFDAAKFARLEKALVNAAALVTAITKTDAALDRQQKPGSNAVLKLTLGYSAAVDQPPAITRETPRQVMLLGRYDWVAKQENLARWAAEVVLMLQAAGIETTVIGHVPQALQTSLAGDGLRFLEEQADLTESQAQGRIGLVAKALDGGFKMKTLDYIFLGLPVAALPGCPIGLPDDVVRNALEAPTPKALTEAISAVIDDLPKLQHMRQGALAAAREVFDWETLGKLLVSAIKEACLRNGVSSR